MDSTDQKFGKASPQLLFEWNLNRVTRIEFIIRFPYSKRFKGFSHLGSWTSTKAKLAVATKSQFCMTLYRISTIKSTVWQCKSLLVQTNARKQRHQNSDSRQHRDKIFTSLSTLNSRKMPFSVMQNIYTKNNRGDRLEGKPQVEWNTKLKFPNFQIVTFLKNIILSYTEKLSY